MNINTYRYIYQHPINQYQYISTRIDEYQDSTFQYVSPINQCPAIHIKNVQKLGGLSENKASKNSTADHYGVL